MAVIGLGLLGFTAGVLYDAATPWGFPQAKRPLGVAAGGCLSAAHIMLILESNWLALPGWLPWLGMPLVVVAASLLAYSLFIELPFRGTYLGSGPGPSLQRTGTYALVRHPGVLWYALFLVALGLVSPSRLLLVAAPVWLMADVGWVLLQERLALLRTFPDYGDYQRETPMLLPTRRSLRACIRTLPKAGSRGSTAHIGR